MHSFSPSHQGSLHARRCWINNVAITRGQTVSELRQQSRLKSRQLIQGNKVWKYIKPGCGRFVRFRTRGLSILCWLSLNTSSAGFTHPHITTHTDGHIRLFSPYCPSSCICEGFSTCSWTISSLWWEIQPLLCLYNGDFTVTIKHLQLTFTEDSHLVKGITAPMTNWPGDRGVLLNFISQVCFPLTLRSGQATNSFV